LHLRVDLPRLLFLFRSQVLPGLHPIQHALLLLWRHTVKVLQLIAQLILPLGRKISELRIVFECFSLLLGRKTLMLAQPLPSVMLLPLRRLFRRMRFGMMAVLRHRKRRA